MMLFNLSFISLFLTGLSIVPTMEKIEESLKQNQTQIQNQKQIKKTSFQNLKYFEKKYQQSKTIIVDEVAWQNFAQNRQNENSENKKTSVVAEATINKDQNEISKLKIDDDIVQSKKSNQISGVDPITGLVFFNYGQETENSSHHVANIKNNKVNFEDYFNQIKSKPNGLIAKNNEINENNENKSDGNAFGLVDGNNSNSKTKSKTKSKSKSYESVTHLSAFGVAKSSEFKKIKELEARFLDEERDYFSSDQNGHITLNYQLANILNNRRVKLVNPNYVETMMSLALEDGEYEYESIPLFHQSFINQLKNGETLEQSGFVVLRLSDDIEDAEIESMEKLYCDENFNLTDTAKARYIIWPNVNFGNNQLQVKLSDGLITSRIILVTGDSVWFEEGYIRVNEKNDYTLSEIYPLAKTTTPLIISPSILENFFVPTTFTKKSLNTYEELDARYLISNRPYYTLKFNDQNFYFATSGNKNIEIPSIDFAKSIIEGLNFEENLNQNCLIQVNLNRPAFEVHYSGWTKEGSSFVDHKLFSDQGEFVDYFGEDTHKIFIIGDEQGIIDVKVNYADGTTDFIQSYCSPSSYLVEQL